jgi:hypothetical protein
MVWRRDFSLRGAKDESFGQVVAWDVDLLSGYPSRFVGPRWREIAPFGAISSFVPAVFSEIRRGGYDAVWVDGHVAAANFMAVAAAKAVGAPVLMRSETHLGLRRSRLKGALRKPALSALYALCDGFLAIGSANRDFYVAMGVPSPVRPRYRFGRLCQCSSGTRQSPFGSGYKALT